MTTIHHDYLIIGAGPAGLQLGYFFEKKGRDYLILERGSSPGQFFRTFPRHRQLISINKIHTGFDDLETNLRWDWNSLLSDREEMLFKHYSRSYFPKHVEMMKYLREFATNFALDIKYNVNVYRIWKRDGSFFLQSTRGQTYSCDRLVVATGATQPYVPPIPGIEHAETYAEISINPGDFEGQAVLLIGKGNSAFETANNLLHTTSRLHLASRKPVTMAWRTHYAGHLRSVNNTLLDSYLLKSQNVLIDADIVKIERDGRKCIVTYRYRHARDEIESLEYDRIILCTGFQFDASIFDESCRPNLVIDDRFPEMTSEWESTNVEYLYFAGTVTQSRDFKKKQSAFIHGFRYNTEFLHRILAKKFHGIPLPYQKLACDPRSLMRVVIQRVNQASSLWQQTGYFCDLIVVSEEGLQYYENLTVDHVQAAFADCEHYYTVTLEFLQEVFDEAPDPFALERIHRDNVAVSEQSPQLHPIIRRFSRGSPVSSHHVIEDIASVWAEDVHTRPLEAYFAEELAEPGRITRREGPAPAQRPGVPIANERC